MKYFYSKHFKYIFEKNRTVTDLMIQFFKIRIIYTFIKGNKYLQLEDIRKFKIEWV